MTSPIVFIVDDDPGILYSLPILLETAHLKSQCFKGPEDFLRICGPQQAGCLLLDVRMPGMSGPELQKELIRRKVRLPIIFLTAHADLPIGVEAMKLGAVDFLTKPINGELLLQRVQAALELNREQRESEAALQLFKMRLSKLTTREREVLALALSGMVNKKISSQLNISLRTIEGHRSRIFLKTGVGSLLELEQQAAKAGVTLASEMSFIKPAVA